MHGYPDSCLLLKPCNHLIGIWCIDLSGSQTRRWKSYFHRWDTWNVTFQAPTTPVALWLLGSVKGWGSIPGRAKPKTLKWGGFCRMEVRVFRGHRTPDLKHSPRALGFLSNRNDVAGTEGVLIGFHRSTTFPSFGNCLSLVLRCGPNPTVASGAIVRAKADRQRLLLI